MYDLFIVVILLTAISHSLASGRFENDTTLIISASIKPIRYLDSLTINKMDDSFLAPHIGCELKIREQLDNSSVPLYAISYQKNETSIKYNRNGRSNSVSFFVLYDIYFGSSGCLSLENWTYQDLNDYNSWVYIGRNELMQGNVSAHYQDLICLGWRHSRENFGHTFFDFLDPLMLIPEEIRMTTPIVMNGLPNVVATVFNLMEIPMNNRVLIKEHTWVHVDRCYTFLRPVVGLSVAGRTTVELRNLFFKKYKLDEIEPTQYYYSNRPTERPRYISNIDELLKSIKIHFPNITFKHLHDSYPSLRKAATHWAKAKFIFTPVGSNCHNSIFMHKETVMVVAQTYEHEEEFIPVFVSSLSIFYLQFPALNCTHFYNFGGPINVSLAIKMIEIGLRCVEDKKWPSHLI